MGGEGGSLAEPCAGPALVVQAGRLVQCPAPGAASAVAMPTGMAVILPRAIKLCHCLQNHMGAGKI